MIHIDINYIHLISHQLEFFKKLRDYLYTCRCPYCGDSQKMKNKTRGYFYRKAEQMNYFCHNCGKSTTAGKVVELVNPDAYKEYVKERFIGTTESEYKFEAPKFEKKDPKLKDLIPINKLSLDHPARQVLVDRQIPEHHYDKFFLSHKFCSWAEISSNQDHPRLVIPFYNEDGEKIEFQGFIDRFDIKDETLTIIDYKTSRHAPSDRFIDKAFTQLYLYALGIKSQERFKNIKKYINLALKKYASDVKSKKYPSKKHSY